MIYINTRNKVNSYKAIHWVTTEWNSQFRQIDQLRTRFLSWLKPQGTTRNCQKVDKTKSMVEEQVEWARTQLFGVHNGTLGSDTVLRHIMYAVSNHQCACTIRLYLPFFGKFMCALICVACTTLLVCWIVYCHCYAHSLKTGDLTNLYTTARVLSTIATCDIVRIRPRI